MKNHQFKINFKEDGTIKSIDTPHAFLMCGECGCHIFTPIVDTSIASGLKSPVVGMICANKPCRNVLKMVGDVAEATTPKKVNNISTETITGENDNGQ